MVEWELGRLNPSDLTAAYARAARRRGVTIVEDARVEGLETKGGEGVGVRTTSGMLAADIVVVAAGLWSRELLEPLDIALAQWGCEHFYVIADIGEPLPRETPSFVAPADLIYGREDVGHFLFGCFDESAVTLDADALPDPLPSLCCRRIGISSRPISRQWPNSSPRCEKRRSDSSSTVPRASRPTVIL